jgi:glycosyltransferase involved in cell wall biosynthesis
MNSINNQTYLNYEVLLVNDGSTDKSANVIAEYITGKKNWFLFSKQNAGPSATRNFGIDHSKGEYLAFVDADDFIEPMYLEKLYEGIIKNKSDLTCCGYYDHSKHGVLSLNNYKNRIGDFVNVKEFTELIFTQIGGVLWDKLFIASIIKKHKVYMDEDIFFSEDVLFILEYFKYTNSISVISDPLYNYNILN